MAPGYQEVHLEPMLDVGNLLEKEQPLSSPKVASRLERRKHQVGVGQGCSSPQSASHNILLGLYISEEILELDVYLSSRICTNPQSLVFEMTSSETEQMCLFSSLEK